MSGTNDGADPQHGLPATGHRFEIPGVTIGRMRDGKIAENKDYYNLAGYLMQVGLIPPHNRRPRPAPEQGLRLSGRPAVGPPRQFRRTSAAVRRVEADLRPGRVTSAVTVSRALTWNYASEHSRDSSAFLAVPCPRCARGAEPAGGGRTCGGFAPCPDSSPHCGVRPAALGSRAPATLTRETVGRSERSGPCHSAPPAPSPEGAADGRDPKAHWNDHTPAVP